MAKNIAISDELAKKLDSIRAQYPILSYSKIIERFLPNSLEDIKVAWLNNILIEAGDEIEELKGFMETIRALAIKLYKLHDEETTNRITEEIERLKNTIGKECKIIQ